MSEIELRHVGKSYGAISILNDISLDMNNGEFVVLVGPSGCGKSTLLRMIAGLEDISAGQIKIGGNVINDIPAKKRDIAMVFQSYALYPHMKVAENMSFALKLAKTPKAEIQQRVQDAASILGLENLLERFPRELSGGQRQRVAMGRAIVRNPRAFLFDEPLSNLDAKLRVKMRSEIKKLHKRLGKTTVYVTHDQIEAMTLADKIVVLNAGKIEQVGSPLELYNSPNSVFVASFIGSPEINLFTAHAQGAAILSNGVTLPLPFAVPDGTEIIYGIRPQHITFGEQGIPATVTLVEPTGDHQEVTVQMGDISLHVIVNSECALSSGENVKLSFDLEKVILFDSSGKNRILHS